MLTDAGVFTCLPTCVFGVIDERTGSKENTIFTVYQVRLSIFNKGHVKQNKYPYIFVKQQTEQKKQE